MPDYAFETTQQPKYFAHNCGKNAFLTELDAEVGTLVIGQSEGKYNAIVTLTPEIITITKHFQLGGRAAVLSFDIERSEFKDLYIRSGGPQALHCLRDLLLVWVKRQPRKNGEILDDKYLRMASRVEGLDDSSTES